MLATNGVVTPETLCEALPPARFSGKGPLAVIECFQSIPCNPCVEACPRGAIYPLDSIHDPPRVDFGKCNGCGLCIFSCPGLAIFIVDDGYMEKRALVKIPYEFDPLPRRGETGLGLGREGQVACPALVEKVQKSPRQNRLSLLWLSIPREYAHEVRFWKRREQHG